MFFFQEKLKTFWGMFFQNGENLRKMNENFYYLKKAIPSNFYLSFLRQISVHPFSICSMTCNNKWLDTSNLEKPSRREGFCTPHPSYCNSDF